jgi:hypothetical protein
MHANKRTEIKSGLHQGAGRVSGYSSSGARLDTHSKLDVALDGADDVDPNLNLVKGGGGGDVGCIKDKRRTATLDQWQAAPFRRVLRESLDPELPSLTIM